MLASNLKPRRVAVIAIVFCIVAVLLLPSSSYHEYVPTKYRPGERVEVAPSSSPYGSHGQLWDEEVSPEPSPSSLSSLPSASSSSSPSVSPERWTGEVARPATHSPSSSSLSSSLSAHSPETGSQSSSSFSFSFSSSSSSSTSSRSSTTSAAGHISTSPVTPELRQETYHKIQELLRDWHPPVGQNHWPPYEPYANLDYDPNRWEGFDWDYDFFLSTGIDQLKDEQHVVAAPFLPYPDYNSPEWKKQWAGEYVACEGATGKRFNESNDEIARAFSALPHNFPAPAIGDANVTGIDLNRCFDRFDRYGPYGLGQGAEQATANAPTSTVDYNNVEWGKLQDRCLEANRGRFRRAAREPPVMAPGKEMPQDHRTLHEELRTMSTTQHQPRTAALIRTWEGYQYTDNDLQSIRAMVTDLNLLSGGEYQVFLFVNIKDKNADIFNNQQVYDDLMRRNVPRELQSMSVLWNERICEEWYPSVGDWQVYWNQFMPLQWFSKTHPEFDFIWNWETDARYTGNHYQFLEGMAKFSKSFPRKYSWERNHRFYFPAAHGTYQEWLNETDAIIEQGIAEGTVIPVWGPEPYGPAQQQPIGPEPPTTLEEDKFEWGVGEEADLITLQPIWDPTNTGWSYRNKIWNFLPGVRPEFTAEEPTDDDFYHPAFANLPRRIYINTVSRFSKRQLHAMHLENLAGRTMQAEMWPASVALHHGLKAVYAPHPIWTDHKWPGWYMDAIFNADGNLTGQWSQREDSPYNHDREYNFMGWSWYYASQFPKALYRRWLGWSNWDVSPMNGLTEQQFHEGVMVGDGSQGRPIVHGQRKGRMCLPPMLLHPVKSVREDWNV
ncbi:hypothetical protein K470DRAFT_255222 [Piedraia hortae CBS 480.64]|uniref:Major facilitator superfamily transporter n=1 Tax=Piedraia hortae CBS 480.64 TaxID=1314780 RepID=A0A6A7C6T5_9PEZI|nr:hypothetical protein K470DRAFT_255222 [Piedraia hortae CBS 480.64]